MSLYHISFKIASQPVLFGAVENGLDAEDMAKLMEWPESIGGFPLKVILVSLSKNSEDTTVQLPNGRAFTLYGQKGQTFQRTLKNSPMFREFIALMDKAQSPPKGNSGKGCDGSPCAT